MSKNIKLFLKHQQAYRISHMACDNSSYANILTHWKNPFSI